MLVVVLLSGTAHAAPPSVIVLSWDGVRHDAPTRTPLPGLQRMAREGAKAERLIPVFPSSTFPNHVSLATGTYPDRHGIVANVFRDRNRGLFDFGDDASWLLAEPIWIAAERQGVPSATFFWVGSETPWRGRAARYRRKPFDGDLPESEKVSQILAWLDLPAAERPRLIMSWWRGADGAGHRHGPDSEEAKAALIGQDAELTRLLAAIDARGLWKDLTLLIVSDHGMSLATEGIDLEAALAPSGMETEILRSTAVAHVFLDNPEQAQRAATLLNAIPGVDAHLASALPRDLRFGPATRVGDVVCITQPPYTFRVGVLDRALRLFHRGVGGHGYPTEHSDVHSVFFALGRGVTAGTRLGSVRAIDVAPTVAALLGIAPPEHSEGASIDFGAEPASP